MRQYSEEVESLAAVPRDADGAVRPGVRRCSLNR